MAGLGGCQNRCHGLGIAHFTHQNHVGILPQNAAQRTGEIRRILADLDLLDDGLAVGMHILDGIFDGHHVIVTRAVDQIDQRGQRGAFPAAGRSRHQNQTLAGFRQTPQRRRQMQRFERRNLFRQQADAARDGAALEMNVGAETPDAFAAEAEVHGLVALQFLLCAGVIKGSSRFRVPSAVSGGPAECESAPPTRSVTGTSAISSRSEAPSRTACASTASSEARFSRVAAGDPAHRERRGSIQRQSSPVRFRSPALFQYHVVDRVKGLTVFRCRQAGNTPAVFYPVEKNVEPTAIDLPFSNHDVDLDCFSGGDDAGSAEPRKHSAHKETGECAPAGPGCGDAGGTPANGGSDESLLGGPGCKTEAAEVQEFSARRDAGPAKPVAARERILILARAGLSARGSA